MTTGFGMPLDQLKPVSDRMDSEQDDRVKSAILQAALDPIITIKSDGTVVGWNPAATEVFGYSKAEAVGRRIGDLIVPPFLRARHEQGLKRYLETGRGSVVGSRAAEMTAMRSDGSTFPVELAIREIKIEDETTFVSYIRDITKKHLLRESEEKFRLLVDGVKDYAIYMLDADGHVISWNTGAENLTGWSHDEIIGKHVSIFRCNDSRDESDQELNITREKGIFHGEVTRCRKDGTTFFAEVTLTALYDDKGELKGYAKVTKDITERKTAERHQNILIAELNHRVKNTLAIVQSIASQTLRYYDADSSFKTHFEGRIRALAIAHDILSSENWEGTDIRSVIDDTLSFYGSMDISGPYLRINPKVSISLSMILHELATNATKYGSRSVEGGRIMIRWDTRNDRFRFIWKESGGPPVTKPTKKGFGSQLLRYGLGFDYDGGRTKISYRQSGMVFMINVPLKNVLETRV